MSEPESGLLTLNCMIGWNGHVAATRERRWRGVLQGYRFARHAGEVNDHIETLPWSDEKIGYLNGRFKQTAVRAYLEERLARKTASTRRNRLQSRSRNGGDISAALRSGTARLCR